MQSVGSFLWYYRMLENGKGEKKKKKKKQRNKEKRKTHIFAFFSKAYLFYFTFNSFFVLFEMYCLHSYLLLIILNQPFSLQFNKTKKNDNFMLWTLHKRVIFTNFPPFLNEWNLNTCYVKELITLRHWSCHKTGLPRNWTMLVNQ